MFLPLLGERAGVSAGVHSFSSPPLIVERPESIFAMNSMNDQRFFDLAMKTMARQCTEAERAELEAIVARQPELKAEWERLQADARLTREIAPLMAATQSSTGEFPAYARERLQTKVKRALGASRSTSAKWRWSWLLGLSGAAAAVVLLAVLSSRPSAPVIEVAFLDTTGAVRSSETNETAVFKQRWANATVQVFDKSTDLDTWQTNRIGNGKPVAKVVYDRAAGEVRVTLSGVGKTLSKTFTVDRDLAAALQESDKFIREQTTR
jgi:hypothetical protein